MMVEYTGEVGAAARGGVEDGGRFGRATQEYLCVDALINRGRRRRAGVILPELWLQLLT